MSNHIHMIVSAKENNISEVLRDFKKYTSKKLLSDIEAYEKESRRIWMLELFAKASEANSRNKRYQF